MTIKTLKDVREKLLGYRFDTVVRLAPIAPERLEAIERGEAPTFLEVERLARLYGLDAETLCQEPVKLSSGDGVAALTSLEEFREVDDLTRSRIVAAASAAKDLINLYRIAGTENVRAEFLRERPRLSARDHRDQPHRQGAALARQLRKHLKLGTKPIPSLRDLMAAAFPALTVLRADLGRDGPAGLGFVDALRGPVIVLNTRGKNENPCVRRFSLAHELCHLLVDWNGREPLASISGYFNERDLERERRANAFAVRFLCPPQIVEQLDEDNEQKLQEVLARYGLPYAAWRLYLRNERGIELPKRPPASMLPLRDASWADAEAPLEIESFPLQEVPTERRTRIAELAARLHSEGKIGRDELAEMLGVTPAAEVERVLDYFAFDLPDDSAEAAG